MISWVRINIHKQQVEGSALFNVFPFFGSIERVFQSDSTSIKIITQYMGRWLANNCLWGQMAVSCTLFLVSVFLKLSSCNVKPS
jgi:hypothetical protein